MNPEVRKSPKENARMIMDLNRKKELLEEKYRLAFFPWWAWITAVLAGGAAGYGVAWNSGYSNADLAHLYIVILAVIIGGAVGCFVLGIIASVNRSKSKSDLRMVNLDLARLSSEELQKNIDKDFYSHLVRINFKYLDQYYLQTERQADKSFTLSCVACIVGLVVLVSGIILMFLGNTTSAIVTAASGVLSEFISAVFFYLYNRTIAKMSQYHQKLVLTQNINLALRITKEMGVEDKNKAYTQLVDRLTDSINKYLTLKEEDDTPAKEKPKDNNATAPAAASPSASA